MNNPYLPAKNYNTYKSIREIKNDELNFIKIRHIYLFYLKHGLTEIYSRYRSGYFEIFLYGGKFIHNKVKLLL